MNKLVHSTSKLVLLLGLAIISISCEKNKTKSVARASHFHLIKDYTTEFECKVKGPVPQSTFLVTIHKHQKVPNNYQLMASLMRVVDSGNFHQKQIHLTKVDVVELQEGWAAYDIEVETTNPKLLAEYSVTGGKLKLYIPSGSNNAVVLDCRNGTFEGAFQGEDEGARQD